MEITMSHYELLCYKKVNRRLFSHLMVMEKAPNIHKLIPQEEDLDPDFCIQTTLSLVRIAHKRGVPLRDYLKQLSSGESGTNPRKRKMMCKRWLDRLNGKSRKHGIPFVCSWCGEHKLRVYETARGFYVGCSDPGDQNCPDTTGTFPTAKEAVAAAMESLASFHYNSGRKCA